MREVFGQPELYVETTQTDHFTDWSTASFACSLPASAHNPSRGHSRLREDSSGAVLPGAQVTLTTWNEGTCTHYDDE